MPQIKFVPFLKMIDGIPSAEVEQPPVDQELIVVFDRTDSIGVNLLDNGQLRLHIWREIFITDGPITIER
jgi:hypothetical protein